MCADLATYIDVDVLHIGSLLCAKCYATIERHSCDYDEAEKAVLDAAVDAGWGVGEYDGPFKKWSLCAACLKGEPQ